ncbi:MAG TPA: helix-turn-helix domain-containing protein [Stellaceae bacterium]|jgi:HTH-type transcriptional regulator/antitoxin HigA|nr:helix-turn-helix domain-containing protein [Stellaceae bacterium]
MTELRPIHCEADYDAALAEIDTYFANEPKRGSPEGDRFEILLALVGAYEKVHWRIEPPSAIDAIREVMALKGYTQKDLGELLGSPSRASELLSLKRPLNMEQAYKLHEAWQVPAECLLAR